MRVGDRVAFWVERDDADGRPVARLAGPARRMEFPAAGVQVVSGSKNRVILAGMTLGGPGLRIVEPALQRTHSNTYFMRDDLHRCALRRQQPGYRFVFECLSVSSHFCLSSPPTRVLILLGRQLF